jgi:glycosyltransferase involved in cell wall biosynthesis
MIACRKIYILISDMSLGGAERVMLSLAQQFSLTHEVEFICLRKKGVLLTELPENTSIHFLNSEDTIQTIMAIRGFFGIRKIFNSNQTSIVISTGTGTNLLACAARFFSLSGTRLIIREACSSRNSNSRVIALLKRILYPKADGMIGVSDGVTEELKQLSGKNQPVVSIPNPIGLQHLHKLADIQDDVLAKITYPFLLTVGRLVPQKNTKLLIDAFAKIEADVSTHLVIIGAGPQDAELRQRITWHGLDSKIHLLGEITNPHPWYKRATAFVLSSDSEGYPNVLLEALAHGLPVISTDCEFGPWQILENGRLGSLVPTADINALAKAMLEVINNSVSFPAWDQSLFDTKIIADRYLQFIEKRGHV